MALRSIEQWTNLLKDTLQFPTVDVDVEAYAKTFVNNSYDKSSIRFLAQSSITDANKLLHDLGVKQGHSLALLAHIKTSTTISSSSHSNEHRKLPPMKRPTVNLDMSQQAYRKFCFDWKAFINHYGVANHKWGSDIYQCCSDDVQSFIVASLSDFLTPNAWHIWQSAWYS